MYGPDPTPVVVAGPVRDAAWHLADARPGPTPRDPPFPPGGGARNAVPLYAFASREVIYHQVSQQVLRVSSLRSLG